MYVKKKYRILLDLTDQQFIIPNSFQKFIEEKEKLHNLVIKSKNNQCWCTYCNNKFTSKTRVNNVVKCPNCKQKLLVKSDRLTKYSFKDNLQLLDKIEYTFVLRTFELYSSYDGSKMKHSITEFMRTFIEDGETNDFVSNNVSNHMGYMYVQHYSNNKGWHGRNHRWAYRDVTGMVSPYNIKSLLKNTDLKYSQLDKFIAKTDYIDFIYYFNLAHYPIFEMLVKMKLYNLIRDASKFYGGKNFQEIFGLPKTYYPFMKKHNINYEQLKVLRLLKKEDIKLINKLVEFHNLEELSRYVDLETAYYKVLRKNKYYEHEYLDYLEMAVMLGYDIKDKKILYPINLMEEHDKLVNLVQEVEDEANDRLIKERLKSLNKISYQDKNYVLFPANSVASLFYESKILNHCVKTYAKRYSLGKTTILFLRDKADREKPLVTVEVKDNKIIQARAKNNANPSDEQWKFLEKWKKKVLDKQLLSI